MMTFPSVPTVRDIADFCADEDIKFVKLTFCDALGQQKNVSILTSELERAFSCGIAFDASAIRGFENETRSDLFLIPEPDTLSVLPWRPEKQRVARLICSVCRPDGSVHECDTRSLLKKAAGEAESAGTELSVSVRHTFTVFNADDGRPVDHAEDFDLFPEDGCCDIRRQVCLNLEKMGMTPGSSHHCTAPGQNSVSFKDMDVLRCADTVMAADTVIKNVAAENGLTVSAGEDTFGLDLRGNAEGFIRSAGSRIEELNSFFVPAGGSLSGLKRTEGGAVQLKAVSRNPYITLALIIYAGLGNGKAIRKRLPGPIAALYS